MDCLLPQLVWAHMQHAHHPSCYNFNLVMPQALEPKPAKPVRLWTIKFLSHKCL